MKRASRSITRRRFDSGFTIVEVAMAAFVMALGISTAILTIQIGFKSLDLARGTTLASQILQSEMERLRLMNWAQISALSAEANVDTTSMFTADPTIAARFTVTRTVSDVVGRVGEMKDIVITTTWTTTDGLRHTRRFQTRYCKNGLYDYYYTLARS